MGDDPTKLNLGCGPDYRHGDAWLNVDVNPECDPDHVVDLEDTPWEWAETDQFGHILADNVLEHIDPRERPAVVGECRRVLSPGGEFVCRLPTYGRWELTHYFVPSYRWPRNPFYSDDWTIQSVRPSKIGPGRLMPDTLALFCQRWDIVRATDEIEVVVT